jgi:hypothetical protein
MPKPFLELTVDEFSEMLNQFPWRRRITEVHVHHTFRPNHADFAARPPARTIEGMFRFHTEERHFSDIAQHVTIDPRGVIWTGRNWNAAPASATGFNGNSTAGPFMFEMIGNFDRGQDRWEGAQRDAAIEVIARVQKLFGLPPDAVRFHHEMSPKSCPGTALVKSEVIEAVAAAHGRLAAPLERGGAFDERASREHATVDRILQVFDVVPAGRDAAAAETELPEAAMSLREAEMSAGDPSAFAAARGGGDTRDLTPEDFALLRKHVVNLRMGALSSGGTFHTSEDDVRAIFTEHLPRFLAGLNQHDPNARLRLVFFAHGGLNDEVESLKNARNRIPFYVENRCYPIFFVWETGPKETLRDILGQIIGFGPGRGIGDVISAFTDPILEQRFRPIGLPMWRTMKLSAQSAFLPKQGGTFLVEQIAGFWKDHHGEMEIHAIGHSAVSIFHGYFLSALCAATATPPIDVETLHFLAPAITVPLFKDTLKALIGSRVKALTEYTMAKDFELADSVGPYRKSLLYLVSRSFEETPEMPILGLQESLRADIEMRDFFGLLGTSHPRAEILFSKVENGPSHSTIARKHGDFDNDRLTMSGVIRRILKVGDDQAIVEFPETVSRTILDATPASVSAPAVVPVEVADVTAIGAPVVVPERPISVATSGRRRAICVGIDAYDAPNTLAGCVNDANGWAAALRALGFDTSTLLNRDATWQAILDVMKDLVSSARAGDVIVFQYAGHGTRVPDADGDETSGRDSALCPVDFPSGRFLIDDDVRQVMHGLADGVNMTCFFDCCHSGTITRLVAPTPLAPRGADVRTRGFFTTPEQKAAHKRFRASLRAVAPPPRGRAEMKEVSFAACTDAQTAQEIDGHGQFTVRALPLLRPGSTISNADFHQRVLAAFGAGASEQTPQLDCAPSAKSRALLSPLVETAAPSAASASAAGVASVPAGAGATASSLDEILARLDGIDRRLARLGV